MELIREAVLAEAGDPVTQVYFPHSGIISLVVNLAGGEMIEAAMIGRDSIFGAAAALDGNISLNKAIVELPGTASVLEIAQLRTAAEQDISLRKMLIRHEQFLSVQAQQNAACNACHPVEARLSRWLLRARDLSDSDTFQLTQEFLAEILGVRRNSVSRVAHALQQAGAIVYRRGIVEITDFAGLHASCCECYETLKAHYERLLQGA